MIRGKKVVVVMPAYNAAQTLLRTHSEVLAQEVVDEVIVVDDASRDGTAAIARALPKTLVHVHAQNSGYGANQKSCYQIALKEGADIVIMVHPDYQYTPKLIPAMAGLIASGLYSCVLGSRILGDGAHRGGMPWWRFAANRALTFFGNVMMGAKLSEYHTGYRAFSRELLEKVPFEKDSDDFVFDNQMLAQILWLGEPVGEISCPTKYFAEASSINFWRSAVYGFGCLGVAVRFRLAKLGLCGGRLFNTPRPPSSL